MVSEDGDAVKDHLRLTHNVKVDMKVIIRKFPCSLCKYSTTSMEEYKNHLINLTIKRNIIGWLKR